MHLVYNCTLKPYFCTTFEPASKHPTHRSIPHKPKEAENGHFVGLRKDLCFLLLGCNDETGKILRNLCVCVRRMRHDLTSGHGRKKPKPSTHVPGDSASQALCCGGGIALSMQTWRAACLQASAQLSKFGLRARPSPSGTTAFIVTCPCHIFVPQTSRLLSFTEGHRQRNEAPGSVAW